MTISAITALIIGICTIATATLSGVFGMAGGQIMLGILLVFLPVAPAMVLFGATQLAANGYRAILLRRYVVWGITLRYMVAGAAAFALMRWLSYLPDKATMYLVMGLMPFAAELLPKSMTPDVTRPGMPYVCGFVVTVLHLLAGAAGTVLDVFFQKSPLDRLSIVATKAVSQVFGHIARIAYFGSFLGSVSDAGPLWLYAEVILCAMLGTQLGAAILHRITDGDFRKWTRIVITCVSLSFIARGLWLWFSGG